jgi:putative membrane protein
LRLCGEKILGILGGDERMFGFLGLVLVVVLAVWAWSYLKKEKGLDFFENTHESALDILKRRYAQGEISKEEFEEKKRDLGL